MIDPVGLDSLQDQPNYCRAERAREQRYLGRQNRSAFPKSADRRVLEQWETDPKIGFERQKIAERKQETRGDTVEMVKLVRRRSVAHGDADKHTLFQALCCLRGVLFDENDDDVHFGVSHIAYDPWLEMTV